jgi:hypothetical protein
MTETSATNLVEYACRDQVATLTLNRPSGADRDPTIWLLFCGRHLLAAKLRRANIDASVGSVEETARIIARIRQRWPRVSILLRADSGFAREALMAWCKSEMVKVGGNFTQLTLVSFRYEVVL